MIKALQLRPTRPLPWIFRGLIGREMLAVAPVLLMLLVMQAFAPFLPMLWKAVGDGTALTLKPESMAVSQWGFFLIAAFLVGVLCGAEEDENGTDIIARQLPIPSIRVFIDKVTGAILALTVWYLLALALNTLILKILGKDIPAQMLDLHYLNASLLMFCFSLGSAAWMRKVIPAAVSSGILAFSWLFSIAQVTDSNVFMRSFMRVEEGAWILYFGCGLTLAAAAWSFVFRKGDGVLFGRKLQPAYILKISHLYSIYACIALALLLINHWTLPPYIARGINIILLVPVPFILIFGGRMHPSSIMRDGDGEITAAQKESLKAGLLFAIPLLGILLILSALTGPENTIFNDAAVGFGFLLEVFSVFLITSEQGINPQIMRVRESLTKKQGAKTAYNGLNLGISLYFILLIISVLIRPGNIMFKTVISIFGLGLFISALINIRYALASGNHVPESKSKTSLSIRERFGIGNPAQREHLKAVLVIGFPMSGLWATVVAFSDIHPVLAGGLLSVIAVILFVTLGKSFGADPLIRSEKTSQKRLVIALGGLILVSPFLAYVVMEGILNLGVNPKPMIGYYGLVGGVFLTVAILSALLWSKEEIDPSRGYLFTLPLPMHQILRLKLRALIYHCSVLIGVALTMALLISLTLDMGDTVQQENYHLGRILKQPAGWFWQVIGLSTGMLLTALPAFALFVVTLKLYFRSVIVTVMLSVLYLPFLALCTVDLVFRFLEDYTFTFEMVFQQGAGWVWLMRQAVLVLGLGGWLFWLYSRSAIHERGPVARFFGALLFVATFYETAFLLLFANYRDLLFIIFGI